MVVGFITLVYLINLVIFTLTAEAQLAAGGLFMIALGGLWIYLAGGPETLICDRARDTCRVIKPRFLLQPRRVEGIRLTSIEEARVEEVYLPSHDGPGRTGYAVVLRARDKGSYSFSLGYSRRSAHAIANRVEAYLKTAGHKSLVVRQVPWLMIAIGAGGIGIGVLLILSAVLGWPYNI
jgi:hypothetical protein